MARPPSVQLIQARPDDPMTAFLVEHRIQSRGTPRELIPLPRPRPKRLNRRFMWPPAWQEEMQRAAQTSLHGSGLCSRSPDGLPVLMEATNRSPIGPSRVITLSQVPAPAEAG